jgi:hypothetical protein
MTYMNALRTAGREGREWAEMSCKCRANDKPAFCHVWQALHQGQEYGVLVPTVPKRARGEANPHFPLEIRRPAPSWVL